MSYVRVSPYSHERIAHLLRLLRPAPESWVTRAQRTISDLILRNEPVTAGVRLTEGDLAALGRALEAPLFRQRFDADPVGASRAAGHPQLASALEQEIQGLVALAERIAEDDAYRTELDADPAATLARSGLPAATAEPLLRALAEPDDALAEPPEVVAHAHEQLPVRARLLVLLLGTSAVAEKMRVVARRA